MLAMFLILSLLWHLLTNMILPDKTQILIVHSTATTPAHVEFNELPNPPEFQYILPSGHKSFSPPPNIIFIFSC